MVGIIFWKSNRHFRKKGLNMRTFLDLAAVRLPNITTWGRILWTNSSNESNTIWNIRECSGCACWLDTASSARHPPCTTRCPPSIPRSDLVSRDLDVWKKYSQYWKVSCTLRQMILCSSELIHPSPEGTSQMIRITLLLMSKCQVLRWQQHWYWQWRWQWHWQWQWQWKHFCRLVLARGKNWQKKDWHCSLSLHHSPLWRRQTNCNFYFSIIEKETRIYRVLGKLQFWFDQKETHLKSEKLQYLFCIASGTLPKQSTNFWSGCDTRI